MLRVKFFVKSAGWKDGGFYNTFYFRTKAEINAWLAEKEPGSITVIKVDEVTAEEAAEDIIY